MTTQLARADTRAELGEDKDAQLGLKSRGTKVRSKGGEDVEWEKETREENRSSSD
jgi:hypothetical protein